MSKNNQVEKRKIERRAKVFSQNEFLQDNTGLFIRGWEMKNLEGRILTLIESAGLPQKQEDALKSYARREIWDTLLGAFVLSEECESYIFQSEAATSPSDITAG